VHVCVCVLDEGVYVDGDGHPIKDIRLQWGEEPSSVGKLPVVRLLYNILYYTVCVCMV
jgi:hypothetical protein